MSTERLQLIQEKLQNALTPSHLEIQDDSHLHIGHAGAGKGGHFSVFIVSEQFTNLNLIKRHRLVYAALDNLMQDEIHALSIKSLSPDEFTQ